MKTRMIAMVIVALGASWASTSEGKPLREIFKRVNSSVVVINSIQTDVIGESQSQPVSVAGLGSGVLISKDGEVITAAHVVQTANKVFVQFSSGEIMTAKVIASEPASDVALLKLSAPPPSGATVAKLGDSDDVEVGDQIFIVGAPLGMGYTLSVGYISARRRSDNVYSGFPLTEFFQTDAAINQGDSGGPMFNMSGEIVGIVSHIMSKSGGSEGLGFAATANMARQFLLERRSLWTGVLGSYITRESAKVFNVPPPGVGMLVQHVAEDSPAALMGLHGGTARATIEGESLVVGGDIILEVQGIPLSIGTYQQIRELIGGLGPGDRIWLKILRGGEQLEIRSPKLP